MLSWRTLFSGLKYQPENCILYVAFFNILHLRASTTSNLHWLHILPVSLVLYATTHRQVCLWTVFYLQSLRVSSPRSNGLLWYTLLVKYSFKAIYQDCLLICTPHSTVHSDHVLHILSTGSNYITHKYNGRCYLQLVLK